MALNLTHEKKLKKKHACCTELVETPNPIKGVDSQVTGNLVTSFPAAPLGPLR